MLELSVQGPGGSHQRIPLQARLTIGRSRENDLFLPDQWLSRHHAEIRSTVGGFLIVDLGSKNGTLLNGRPVRGEAALRPGDMIVLGEHTLSLIEATASATLVDEEDSEPAGTQIFSAKDLSAAATLPTTDIEELARQNRVLTILSRASRELIAHRPLSELFEQILNLLFEAVPAERGAILLLDGSTSDLRIAASRSRHGQPIAAISRSIARKTLEGGALLLPNVMEDTALQSQDSILSLGIRSAVCVPLWLTTQSATQQENVIGLVYLDTLKDYHSFTEDDLRILTTLANVAAAKIENARLMEESLEKRSLEEDLRVAAQIQRSMLPASSPEIAGYELVGSQRTSRTIGGDYYDFVAYDKGVVLALGDVSGKGTGAALMMTVLRAAVRGNWLIGDPAEAVSSINRFMKQNVPDGKFVTFFLARLDPKTHTLTYSNAGHNPPLVLRNDGQIETLGKGGPVLGIIDAALYDQATVKIEPGETVLIYSDGLSETWSEDGKELGDDGLAALARASSHMGARDLEAELLRGIDAFSAGAKPTDDRTLIILKRVT